MSSSYVSNHIHLVFNTKNRRALITEDIEPKLWAYMTGILRNYHLQPVSIGGIADHVHALIDLGPTSNIAQTAQVLKANSSRWMTEHAGTRFEWQEGYFACSVSRSQVPAVARYVAQQKEHHRRIDSTGEFALLLKRHGFLLRE
jgi:putative transposase